MRNRNRRLSVERLFVLGAGASFDASASSSSIRQAPLDKDFTARIDSLDVSKPGWVREARDRVIDQWRGEALFSNVGLEEAVLRQLGHLEFIEAVQPRRGKNAITELEWLSLVTHLLCYVLRRCHESPRRTYERFSKLAYPVDGNEANRIITFNYDDLLDRHLVRRFGVRKVYFDKIMDRPGGNNRRSDTYDDPLLIKLHGSINWRCSDTEFQGVVESSFDDSPHKIPEIWYVETAVAKPAESVCPLVVPPLPAKPLSSVKLFQYLWTRAYEYLHSARDLVICGYSLPATDTMAWSLFSNFRNKQLQSVTIVDPDPAIISKWLRLLRRNGVGSFEVRYYETFSDYVDTMAP